ncbi:hypothetical protein L7F22_032651 [Adiantum nelumboides]|nr:hypothetical protein [Adiantum nelumboides]
MSKNDGISSLVSDKLGKNNFHAWKFRMTNFMMSKGYWDCIDGNQEKMPELPDVNPTSEQINAFKDWNQGAMKVMYWMSVSVQDTMIGHIQDATLPKQAWDRLVSIDTTNMKAWKIQLKNELNTVKKENLSINDYTLSSKAIQNPGYVETRDDTAHPIAHTGNVPLSLQDGNVKYLADVLEQGLQVRFNADGLYVEEYKKNGKLIVQGKKVGIMFTLDVNIPELNAVMFAHGSGVDADIEIWHKRIEHANLQRLKIMQSQEHVRGLHVFKVANMQKVCEACQFGKQAKASFLHDKHVRKNVLELVHSDVWGLAKTASMGGCRFTGFCKMSKNDGISGLVSDKLDKNNFHAWKSRMTNFLMGKGYWDFIDGNQKEMPKLPDVNPTAKQIKAFKDWNQGARKVMYWLSVSVQNTMIGHIQDATSPKQDWDSYRPGLLVMSM